MSAVMIEGIERLQARIAALGRRMPQAASIAAAAGAEHVRSVMITRFLNGQVIGRVDHALIGQWNVRSSISPPAAVLGTGVPYARAQEYGFRGIVQVRAHRRRQQFRRKLTRTGRLESFRSFSRRRTAFQESPAGEFSVEVRGHSRRMNLPPRRFLRGAIEASRGSIVGIVDAVWRREIAG